MKILIADDDPLMLDTIRLCVTTEGFQAITCSDGEQAFAVWEQHRPTIVCLDIMMPKLDGYEVCRRIRAIDRKVPIVFLSAKSEEIDVVVGLQLGADDFLRKPFGKHELIARIRAALRRNHSAYEHSDSFTMRDLTVWPSELRAERASQSIDITPREARILKIFYERAGQVVDRDTILNQCWGIDYFPESRTLDQHIAKLRKRIEIDPDQPLIETVRGIGYRFRIRE
jgi:two-component system, OmpR family, alkaline phosphatase synthesis response regulator PhoP